jgi:hypothetical protein
MINIKNMEKEELNPELKEIIIRRIESSRLPSNILMSIGDMSDEPMNLQEVISHVKKEDEIGKKILQMEVEYLKALKEGIVSKI